MVTHTVKVSRLYEISRKFAVDPSDEDSPIIIISEGQRTYHLIPTPETVATLKAIENKFSQIMTVAIDVEGAIDEVWEVQQVEETQTVSRLVRIQ